VVWTRIIMLGGNKEYMFSNLVGNRLCGLVVEFLATDPEVGVRFPALSHFLRSSGSGTGSTQPREYS
jgi:hypothetical protein